MTTTDSGLDHIRQYYGRHLKNYRDLKTDACCAVDGLPAHIQSIMTQIAPEVCEKFYGCGSPVPPAVEGRTVLDLGCGAGRDVYICSKLVGERGRVVGVDMTEEQLAVAQRYREFHARAFGHAEPNVTLRRGYIEDLAAAGVEDDSVDVVISNCVINLSPDKGRLFSEVFRVLKPGGELYFSDVFADRRLPAAWREDPLLVGECLAGAMYREDFRRMLNRIGISDYRVTTERPIAVNNADIAAKVGAARFSSATVRAFNIASLEDRCEDYGQAVRYLGTVQHAPHSFVLDDHHEFVTGKWTPVCGNTAAMLSDTRLGAHFEVLGDRSRHFGPFPQHGSGASGRTAAVGGSGCC